MQEFALMWALGGKRPIRRASGKRTPSFPCDFHLRRVFASSYGQTRLLFGLTVSRKPIYRISNMKPTYNEFLPLSPATLQVLLALTSGELHGYGIMLEVARQSGGQYKIGPGTLYDNIKKLLKLGLVEEAAAVGTESEPRRTYRLTRLGGLVLEAETERLEGVIRVARQGLRPREEEA